MCYEFKTLDFDLIYPLRMDRIERMMDIARKLNPYVDTTGESGQPKEGKSISDLASEVRGKKSA